MKIIAHRGYHLEGEVENSLEAIQAAIKIGCDGVEVDVRCTKDNVPVLCHDRSIKVWGQTFLIAETEYSTIKKYVCNLYDVLDVIDDEFLLNLEIKSYDAVHSTLKAIENRNKNYLITSFIHPLLKKFYSYRRGSLISHGVDVEYKVKVDYLVAFAETFNENMFPKEKTILYGVEEKISDGYYAIITDYPKLWIA